MAVILGIDPGSRKTGYGLINANGNKLEYVACGAIKTGDTALPDRLKQIFDGLNEVIVRHCPRQAAIEEVFVNRNLQTATSVGRASGVALLCLARAGLTVAEYTPSAVKLAVTGSGDAEKRQVQHLVARRLGLAAAPSPADAADALAIAICHAQAARPLAARRGA